MNFLLFASSVLQVAEVKAVKATPSTLNPLDTTFSTTDISAEVNPNDTIKNATTRNGAIEAVARDALEKTKEEVLATTRGSAFKVTAQELIVATGRSVENAIGGGTDTRFGATDYARIHAKELEKLALKANEKLDEKEHAKEEPRKKNLAPQKQRIGQAEGSKQSEKDQLALSTEVANPLDQPMSFKFSAKGGKTEQAVQKQFSNQMPEEMETPLSAGFNRIAGITNKKDNPKGKEANGNVDTAKIGASESFANRLGNGVNDTVSAQFTKESTALGETLQEKANPKKFTKSQIDNLSLT